MKTMNKIIRTINIPDPTNSPLAVPCRKPDTSSSKFNASRNMNIRTTKTNPINAVLHGPFSRNTPWASSLKNEPTSNRNRTTNNSKTTNFEDTSVITSTRFEEATTRNAITKAAAEFKFFLEYSFPSIFSVPNPFV